MQGGRVKVWEGEKEKKEGIHQNRDSTRAEHMSELRTSFCSENH